MQCNEMNKKKQKKHRKQTQIIFNLNNHNNQIN